MNLFGTINVEEKGLGSMFIGVGLPNSWFVSWCQGLLFQYWTPYWYHSITVSVRSLVWYEAAYRFSTVYSILGVMVRYGKPWLVHLK